MTVAAAATLPRRHAALEQAGVFAVYGVAGALQFSIAVAQILLTVAICCWIALVILDRETIDIPSFAWPLGAYIAITLVATAFSPDPRTSLMASKQMVLFLLVPLVYRFATGARAATMVTVIVSCAAASAAVGIVQYGILHYDNLGQRPQGTLGHYMTYSGLLMLVIGTALARVLFGTRDRMWSALVMPALVVALPLTFARSAEVGVCAGVALLLLLKDRRLLAVLPVLAALFFVLAPARVTDRFESIFNLKNPTNLDRLVMLREGAHMIKDHPLLGIGPNMVQPLYAQYREPDAVNARQPASAQRPGADRRRTRPARARHLALVHRGADRRARETDAREGSEDACRHGARDGHIDAGRRHVRIQLRGFGIPDALPRPRHPAICGRTDDDHLTLRFAHRSMQLPARLGSASEGS